MQMNKLALCRRHPIGVVSLYRYSRDIPLVQILKTWQNTINVKFMPCSKVMWLCGYVELLITGYNLGTSQPPQLQQSCKRLLLLTNELPMTQALRCMVEEACLNHKQVQCQFTPGVEYRYPRGSVQVPRGVVYMYPRG